MWDSYAQTHSPETSRAARWRQSEPKARNTPSFSCAISPQRESVPPSRFGLRRRKETRFLIGCLGVLTPGLCLSASRVGVTAYPTEKREIVQESRERIRRARQTFPGCRAHNTHNLSALPAQNASFLPQSSLVESRRPAGPGRWTQPPRAASNSGVNGLISHSSHT